MGIQTAEAAPSFDDDVVVELPKEGEVSTGSKQSDGFDSFDDDVVVELPKKEESEFTDGQVNKLDDDDGTKKEVKDPEPKEDKKDDEKVPEKTDEEKAEKPKGKTLRVKDSSGTVHELDADSTVKVKVKGKNEFVSIEELKSNYSGEKAWSTEIESAKEKTKEAESKLESFQAEKAGIVTNLEKIASMLDDEERSPLDALDFLVDFTGRDTVAFKKRVMEYLSSEVNTLDGMDDVERELYWKNKEVESFRNNQAAKADEIKQTEAEKGRVAKIDQMRESQGVSEQQFMDSHQDLVSLGYKPNEITPEAMVNYAVMKPHFEKAESTCASYQEDLGDDDFDTLVGTVAKTLRNYPNVSEQKALEVSLDQLGWDYGTEDDDFAELNKKVVKQVDPELQYKKVEKEGHIESFDDWD